MPIIYGGSGNIGSIPDKYIVVNTPVSNVGPSIPSDILGIVGIASWGKTNAPVIIRSVEDYKRNFGDVLNLKHDLGTAAYAAMNEGATNLRCVRVTDGTDTKADADIMDTAGTPAIGMTLTALYSGIVGNTLSVIVAKSSAYTTTTPQYVFTINRPGYSSEIYDYIGGTGAALWQNIVDAINNGNESRAKSQLVTAAIGVGTAVPAENSYILSGGTNGNTTIDTEVLIGTDGVSSRTGMYALRGTNCSVVMLADADDNTFWKDQYDFSLSESCYVMLCPTSGSRYSVATIVENMESAEIDFWTTKMNLSWVLFKDLTNKVTRLISPQATTAGVLCSIQPYESGCNKRIKGIVGTEDTMESRPYSNAELEVLQSAGIDVIAYPAPGGDYFALRLGRNTSQVSDVTNDDSYPRFVNYLSKNLDLIAGPFVKAPRTPRTEHLLDSAISNFLNKFQRPDIYGNVAIEWYKVICDDTNNPPGDLNLNATVYIKLYGVVQQVIIQLTASQTLNS